jgi:DNA processing protein
LNPRLQTDLSYWIATSHLSGVKTSKLLSWLEQRGDFQSLFSASAAVLVAAQFTAADIDNIKNVPWRTIEAERSWYEQQGLVLCLQDPRYPPLLKEIADPPLVLYVYGDVQLLSLPQLAIVGSRNPSPLGQQTAARFARALATEGLVITSGLALGIDGACHQATLAAQGKTIAVMGTGLNQIYPQAHRGLAEKLMQQGAIISELPLNTPPSPWNFPRRNRIISGLSLGVLVVEAALRSGSLITARCAVEQNREVFAIPGSIHHPLARGCHQLIRQGAKLVESAQDIMEELTALTAFVKRRESLSPENSPAVAHSLNDLDAAHKVVLDHVDRAVTAFDAIRLRSGLTTSEVSSILLSLELNGCIQVVQGGYIRCT